MKTQFDQGGVTIDTVEIPPRFRESLNEKSVISLMDSIQKIGLQTPITVRNVTSDSSILVAGRHRVEACRRLGMQEIPANIIEGTDDECRLWEISENLHRADLDKVERAEHIEEWNRLTAEIEKAAKKPNAQVAHSGGKPSKGHSATARKLGITRDEVARAAPIAAIDPKAKEAARKGGIANNQKALLAVSKEPTAAKQTAKVAEIVAAKTAPKPKLDTKEAWLKDMQARWLNYMQNAYERGRPDWQDEFWKRKGVSL